MDAAGSDSVSPEAAIRHNRHRSLPGPRLHDWRRLCEGATPHVGQNHRGERAGICCEGPVRASIAPRFLLMRASDWTPGPMQIDLPSGNYATITHFNSEDGPWPPRRAAGRPPGAASPSAFPRPPCDCGG